MPKHKIKTKAMTRRIERWLELVRAKEKAEGERVRDNWPVHEMGCSCRFMAENMPALESYQGKKKKGGLGEK